MAAARSIPGLSQRLDTADGVLLPNCRVRQNAARAGSPRTVSFVKVGNATVGFEIQT